METFSDVDLSEVFVACESPKQKKNIRRVLDDKLAYPFASKTLLRILHMAWLGFLLNLLSPAPLGK